MTYIARHYVRVNGKMFTPGEIITETIARDKAVRLSALNAIAAVPEDDSPDPVADALPTPNDTHAPVEPEGGKQDADAEKEAEPESVETKTGNEDEQLAEENDVGNDEEEATPLEIDVADSIVPAQEPEEEPVSAPRKRGKKK